MAKHRKPEGEGAVNPEILRVACEVSRRLSAAGHAHALIGGLAVWAHGYERATADVDFLVTRRAEASLTGDPLGGEARGKTIRVDGVLVDLLFPKAEEDYLEWAITKSCARVIDALPVLPLDALVCMKLACGRMRDQGDVVELIKRGWIDRRVVVAYLAVNRPDLVEEFESLVALAACEVD